MVAVKSYAVTAHTKIISYAGSWSDRDGVTYRVLAGTKAEAISKARKVRRDQEGRQATPVVRWVAVEEAGEG
jgi:hypothetical protein